jgi:neutral trehalase
VYKSFNKVLDRYASSNAQYLNGYVSMNNSLAKIRKFKDSWNSKLFELNLSDKVFKALINATESNLDVLQKYFTLKKDALGLDELHMYDMALDMADNDKEYTEKQLESFEYAVNKMKSLVDLKYIHAAASNAILNYPNSHYNLVRPGIIMYGYSSDEESCRSIDLKPVAILKSKVTFLKKVKEFTLKL